VHQHNLKAVRSYEEHFKTRHSASIAHRVRLESLSQQLLAIEEEIKRIL
jgi:hypothetical protein